MRAGLIALAAACGIPLLGGCEPHRSDPPPPDAGDDGRTVLVTALESDPGHLNPAITTGGGVHTAAELVFNGLVELDGGLEPVPGLAERWEVEEGGRRYRFHLRRGVRWHDGAPFGAADVAYTFRQVLLRYHSRTRASLGTALDSVTTPDDHTVTFHFAEPYAPLLHQLHVHEAPILPRHLYEGTDPLTNPHNVEPVGTGPFRFESYRRGAEIRLSANPDYFREGLPGLAGVIHRVIPDPGTQLLALEAGEVDWLYGVPGPERARLEADPGYALLEATALPGGANCLMTVAFNLDRPVLADVRVRRAIAHALDRRAVVDRILFGAGRVAEAPISSGIAWAHAGGLPVPGLDPDRARSLLDEADWRPGPDGIRVASGVPGVADGTRLSVGFTHFPGLSAYGQLFRANLREVGVELVQHPLEPPVMVKRVFEDRDFDTTIVSYCNGTDPEIGVRRIYVSDNIAPVPFSNAAGYSNREVDRLFDLARGTLDREERSRAYRRVQEILVEDLPYLWIAETVSVRAHRAECEDFRTVGHFAERARCGG